MFCFLGYSRPGVEKRVKHQSHGERHRCPHQNTQTQQQPHQHRRGDPRVALVPARVGGHGRGAPRVRVPVRPGGRQPPPGAGGQQRQPPHSTRHPCRGACLLWQ